MTAFALLMFSLLQPASAERDIRAALERQAADWNRGDLEAFTKLYSEDAFFIGRTVTRGAAQVLERYRKGYPTRAAMGTLRFTLLHFVPAGADHMLVIGRFDLERTTEGGGPANGLFSLLMRREKGAWKIGSDHTSGPAEPAKR